jgi:mRNA-degrading endonuclease RelE of RelBE toxin-antitoxin system
VGNFEVLLMPVAFKFYKSCPEELAKRLNKCLEDLENNPFWGSEYQDIKGRKETV